jgi:C-terminal processing protease CtpA/Prc
VPAIAFALAVAGEGWLVSDGRLIPEMERGVDMGEGVLAIVRVTDMSPQVKVDVEVRAGKDPVAAAVALARSAKVKKATAATAAAPMRWRPDATYADPPYPSKELRLLALFRYWNIIHFFYPYLHLIGDWDAVLPEFIPKLEAAPDALGYAQAVAELMTRVPDGHSRLRGSKALTAYLGEGRPRVDVRLVEGRPVVVKVLDHELAVKVGDVLVAVDGEPVERRAERLGKLVSASTSAAHAQYVAALLLAGPVDSTAKVTVSGADDKVREAQLPRIIPTPPPDPPKEEVVKLLPGNIGYVNLNYLERADVDAMFAKLKDSKAIVFDLRGYPRGVAWSIAPRINRNKARFAAHFERNELDSGQPRRMTFDQPLAPSPGPIYANPTVMLIDDRTISQAEHTGLFLEAASGTKFVGSSSAGANGDVTTIVLPGGLSAWMTGHDVRHIDGRQLQRIGLVPDVRVEPTIQGLRKGRDEVLEAALRMLAASK